MKHIKTILCLLTILPLISVKANTIHITPEINIESCDYLSATIDFNFDVLTDPEILTDVEIYFRLQSNINGLAIDVLKHPHIEYEKGQYVYRRTHLRNNMIIIIGGHDSLPIPNPYHIGIAIMDINYSLHDDSYTITHNNNTQFCPYIEQQQQEQEEDPDSNDNGGFPDFIHGQNLRTIGERVVGLKLFPNPASDYLNVELEGFHEPILEIEILDIAGRRVLETTLNMDLRKVDISRLQPGVYIIKIRNNERVLAKRFIKN